MRASGSLAAAGAEQKSVRVKVHAIKRGGMDGFQGGMLTAAMRI
jgi:hypothetical protein